MRRPFAPVRGTHLNRATCPYIDPATLTEPTRKFERVQTIMIQDRQYQIAVFWNRRNRIDEMPHAGFLTTLRHISIDLAQIS
jgi:hypothetical protein